jgi:hypothetical protein
MAREERERFLRRREEEKQARPRRPAGTKAAPPGEAKSGDAVPATAEDDARRPVPPQGPVAHAVAEQPRQAGDRGCPSVTSADDATDPGTTDNPPPSGSDHVTDGRIPGPDADPEVEPVDEALVRQLDDLWRGAGHATRLAFLARPAVQAALRRLDAPRLSA